MALNADALAGSILAAFSASFSANWPTMKNYAVGESEKLAHSLVQITTLRLANQISDAEASVMLEMQKNASRNVFLALQGMALLAVETAINGALAAVRDAVNAAIGFALL